MTKDETLKLALDAFGEIAWSNETQWQRDRAKEAITAIKEALAQPEQEPVGWAEHGVINWLADKQFNHTSFLYATPPQRTWVGLTDEEVNKLVDDEDWYNDPHKFSRIVEAKVREKNYAS